jgi:hypothetical protein
MARPERFDPYRVLGVARGATQAEVARAYRALAKQLHPDLHGPEAAGRMQDLNRSWEILSDPARRRSWDQVHPAAVAGGRHWSGSPRPAPVPARTDAAAWAAWEAARRPATVPGPERVRPAETWPRRADAPPGPSGVRDSVWLAAGVGGVMVVGLLVLGWLASVRPGAESAGDAFAAARVAPGVRAALDPDHEAAVFEVPGGMLGVAIAREIGSGWEASVLEERADTTDISVRVAHADGGGSWRTVVYGRAPEGVARVRLSVASVGGEVANGLWVIGLRAPVNAAQVAWRFEDAKGALVLAGSGELH